MKRLRRKRKPRGARRRPVNVLASGMTVIGLYLGTRSIFASIEQEYALAAYLILGAIFFDMFDGTVAKLTKTTSEFGKQLDSLCDLVSFGVAPAVLVYNAYQVYNPAPGSFAEKTGSLVALVAIVFVICAALRLARFNAYQAEEREWFVGLPSPAAGGTVAVFVLFVQYFETRVEYYALGMVTFALSILMVSNVMYPKERVKTFVFAPKRAFMILGFGAYVIALIHYAILISPAIVLFPLACTYVLFGLGYTLHHQFTRTAPAAPAAEAGPAAEAAAVQEPAAAQAPPSAPPSGGEPAPGEDAGSSPRYSGERS